MGVVIIVSMINGKMNGMYGIFKYVLEVQTGVEVYYVDTASNPWVL
jgi:hypothetical protein